MKKGKYEREKIRAIDRYLVLILIAVISIGIAYAQIAEEKLTVTVNAETEVQEGVFISKIAYKSNVGADTTNSLINYYLGTMMDSKVVLGSSSNSTITYEVTVYNNTDKEQVFIKTLTDDTDEILYSNTNIGYSVSIEDYVTTIAPKQSLTFTITFAYEGTDTSNPVLESKLNFRFREKPVMELCNEGTTYTLENISTGHIEEYEFTVKNNNTTYTNGVPMTYTFATTLTEGSPLTAEIYDASGNKVTGDITLAGDGTTAEHTYKLKLTWDSSKTDTSYYNKEYSCNVKLVATPTEAKYLDYEITKEFNVNISTTCNHNFAKPAETGIKYTETTEYTDKNGDTAMIPAGFTVSGRGGTCTICGIENPSDETIIEEGLVVYLIDDKTEAEIEAINWSDEEAVLNLRKTYDQFVWIPMAQENINDMYMCQSEDGTKSCKIGLNSSGKAYCSTHSSNQMAGRLYAESRGENFASSLTNQTYETGSGLREPDSVTSGSDMDGQPSNLTKINNIIGTSYATADEFKTGLQKEYNEIVKSVYQNKGFYVGRYETSNLSQTDGTTVTVVAGTTAGLRSVDWYYMYAQQKDYATNNGITSSVETSMIQGAAYDQVMIYVDPSTSFVKATNTVSHDLEEAYQTGGLNYTGTINYNDVAKNIYDLSGNMSVWTTEAYSYVRIWRGGSWGAEYSASYRGNEYPSNGFYTYLGTMMQLYIVCDHTYENGVCTKCGEECQHQNENGTCSICGMKLTAAPGVRVTENTPYVSGNYTAMIPAGFTVSGVASEQSIENGLVIYLIPEGETVNWSDGTAVATAQQTYDQFVWIPVDDINDMYMCQSEDGTKSCRITVQNGEAYCTTHGSNLMAGRLYNADTLSDFNANLTTQKYTSGTGFNEPDIVSSTDIGKELFNFNVIMSTNYAMPRDFKTDLQREYNEIVKSVYQNEGFYIGRFETSGFGSTTNFTNGAVTDFSKNIKVVAGSDNTINANVSGISWNHMYAEQRNYAEQVGLNLSMGSTAIQGAAYDQLMKFVSTDSYNIYESVQTGHDSSLENAMTSVMQTGGLNYNTIYTGTVEYNDVSKNIYDLEGNVHTGTATVYGTDRRVQRGGDFQYGDGYPASKATLTYSDTIADYTLGSICMLYVRCSHSEENCVCLLCGERLHDYNSGKCVTCGANCSHCFINGVCVECGSSCSHTYVDNVCSVCLLCEHQWNSTDGVCSLCSSWCPNSGNHSSTACSICGYKSSDCITEGTLITLANGTQVAVEDLTGDEKLLVWNLETGKYEEAEIAYIIDHGGESAERDIIHLYFSDGSDIEIIYDHGFYDLDLNKLVYINADNYEEFIGDWFVTQKLGTEDEWNKVQLTDVKFEKRNTVEYEVVTYEYLTCYTNGLLSISSLLNPFCNIFEVDEATLSYDKELMAKDIEEYGLFTYEDFKDRIPEYVFNLYHVDYLKVALGKGLTNWDEIEFLIAYYHTEIAPLVKDKVENYDKDKETINSNTETYNPYSYNYYKSQIREYVQKNKYLLNRGFAEFE